jgi:hypothetical protein
MSSGARGAGNVHITLHTLRGTSLVRAVSTALALPFYFGTSAPGDGKSVRGVLRRFFHFFRLAADVIGADHPPLAEKLRRVSSYWMRHTRATHALGRGAELTQST